MSAALSRARAICEPSVSMTVRSPAVNGVGAPTTSTPRSPLGACNADADRAGGSAARRARSSRRLQVGERDADRAWHRRDREVDVARRRDEDDVVSPSTSTSDETASGRSTTARDGGDRGDADPVDVDGGDERRGAVAQRSFPRDAVEASARLRTNIRASARTNSTIDEASSTWHWSRPRSSPAASSTAGASRQLR